MWRKRPGIYPIRYDNKVQLLQSGAPFFENLEELIKDAKIEIHFQVYIFEPDTTGERIGRLLMEAAQRGVEVYMILDSYGSKNFTEAWKYKFRTAGIHLYFFSPFTFGDTHLGMRLHHKLMVFDKHTALTGGINISDHYSHYTGKTPWLDFAIKSKGRVVHDVLWICNGTLHTVHARNKHKSKSTTNLPVNTHLPVHVRLLQNNWIKGRFGISWHYRKQIRLAKKEILIFASYFIPPLALKRFLKKASQRGVKVTMVLGAVSDVGLVRRASEHFYPDMLNAGIELYEWRPNVLHAKLALVDGEWLSVGSYNLNHLSDFGSIECNMEVYDRSFCENTRQYLQQIIEKDCDHISLVLYNKRRGMLNRMINTICYALVRLSLSFLFFLQSRQEKAVRR